MELSFVRSASRQSDTGARKQKIAISLIDGDPGSRSVVSAGSTIIGHRAQGVATVAERDRNASGCPGQLESSNRQLAENEKRQSGDWVQEKPDWVRLRVKIGVK